MNSPCQFARMMAGGTNHYAFRAPARERSLRLFASTYSDSCPFLRSMSTTPLQMNKTEIDKFENKCPFGNMVFMELPKKNEQKREYHVDAKNNMKEQKLNSINHAEAMTTGQTPLWPQDPTINVIPRQDRTTMTEYSTTPNKEEMLLRKERLSKQCFADVLMKMKQDGNYRKFNHIDRKVGQFPKADNRLDIRPAHIPETQGWADVAQNDIMVWCNNDYLGMGQHPVVLTAMKDAIDQFGAGSGGTRNISGTTSLHVRLERELSDLHHKESAILFSSCYTANASMIPTLGKMMPENSIIFSDAKNHASLIEGIRNSRADKRIFRHNDVEHLRELLMNADPSAAKIIIFESVYSMDGTIAPIEQICDLADEFGAFTILDEVHAVGLYGPRGGGVAEELNLLDRLDMITGTLGKAYGLYGGFITGKAEVIDSIRSFAPGFIFTTSLPPAIVGGALASVKYLKDSNGERLAQKANSLYLKQRLREVGLPVMHSPSHIVPLLVGDSKLCRAMSDMLLEKHRIYAQPINYPTVAKGTERFRLTPTPVHTKEHIETLIASLLDCWQHFGKPLMPRDL